jgi:hypothetical protein
MNIPASRRIVNADMSLPEGARRLIRLVEFLALLVLCALFVAKGLLPGWRSLRSDFGNYYIVARLLLEHYPMDRIYDWIWLQRAKDHLSIQEPYAAFLGLTPFSALPLLPLAWLDALEAKRIWLVMNLGILAGSIYGMHKVTGIGRRRVALIGFLAFIPLRNNFALGQMHVVVLALLVLAYWLYTRNMKLGCGTALGLAASLKVYPLFFVFFFLRKREWKAAAVLVGSTLGLLAACFPIFGLPAMREFLIAQFPRMLRGEVTDPFNLWAPSASTLFHRVFIAQPQTNPHPIFESPFLFALLYPLWQLGLLAVTLVLISPTSADPKRADSHRRALEWASWICLLLALSTEPASYHRVVLAFVAVLGLYAIESAWRKAVLLVCYFVACNVHPIVSDQHLFRAILVDFLPLWALVAMQFCLLAALQARQNVPLAPLDARFDLPRLKTAWVLATFIAIWGTVSATTFVHVRGMSSSNDRMDRSIGVSGRFSPHMSDNHLLTVAMVVEGYRVLDENGSHYQTDPDGTEFDQLAIAANPNSRLIWIEAAEEGHSRLVELQTDPGNTGSVPIATILDAESPALSPDGKSLMFIRETRGIGSAWIVSLDKDGQVLTAPAPIGLAGMDVRDGEFSGPDSILVSAAEKGVTHLFVIRGGESPQRDFSNVDAMDLPVPNAEDSMLLYEQEINGVWRLFASEPERGRAMQLTFGDCNAYDPMWLDATHAIYVSDCGRGMKFGALADLTVRIAH